LLAQAGQLRERRTLTNQFLGLGQLASQLFAVHSLRRRRQRVCLLRGLLSQDALNQRG
jgi:hypothetical protein